MGFLFCGKTSIIKFFSKLTGSRFTMLESSSAPYQQKKSALSQETVRRLMNTSDDSNLEDRLEILNEYDRKLKNSGYSKNQRREIIESGIVGYKRKLVRQNGTMHIKSTDTKNNRIQKKLCEKTTWFKNKKSHNSTKNTEKQTKCRQTSPKDKVPRQKIKKTDSPKDRNPSAVIFIPRTKGGELAKRIREKEIELNKHTIQRVKIIERNGDRLQHVLVRTDHYGDRLITCKVLK